MSNDTIFGTLEFTGGDMAWPGVKCDRLATDNTGGLLFASILADTGIIKGVRAVLGTDKRAYITGKNLPLYGDHSYGQGVMSERNAGSINRLDGGYKIEVHRLPYGMAHAFATSRTTGLMLGSSDAHLWAKLTEPAFTTPILREWVGYVAKQLRAAGKLADARVYRCECSVLTATVADVDEVVSKGLKSGALQIPLRPAIIAAA